MRAASACVRPDPTGGAETTTNVSQQGGICLDLTLRMLLNDVLGLAAMEGVPRGRDEHERYRTVLGSAVCRGTDAAS